MKNAATQPVKAEALRELHAGKSLLVLPNVWNPIGARILEKKGFPAIATASAAIAESLGYRDGERIRFSTLLEILERIAGSVSVPVTADIESGYADSVDALRESIRSVLETGVVGINIEDCFEEGGDLRSIDGQSERIRAVRSVAEELDIPLVINARIDCFLSLSDRPLDSQIEEAVERAKAYREAGADCVYPIGPASRETLETLRDRIEGPINALGNSSAIPLEEMQEIGVNRVSFGPFVFRSCLKTFSDIADELQNLSPYESFGKNMFSSAEMEAFLREDKE